MATEQQIKIAAKLYEAREQQITITDALNNPLVSGDVIYDVSGLRGIDKRTVIGLYGRGRGWIECVPEHRLAMTVDRRHAFKDFRDALLARIKIVEKRIAAGRYTVNRNEAYLSELQNELAKSERIKVSPPSAPISEA